MPTEVKETLGASEQPAARSVFGKQIAPHEKHAGPLRWHRAASGLRLLSPGLIANDLLASSNLNTESLNRARTMTTLQKSVGNTRLSRMLETPMQPKVTVSTPSDDDEREADRTADVVMRISEPIDGRPSSTLSSIQPNRARRACPGCEKEVAAPQLHVQRLCSECVKELKRQPRDSEAPLINPELEGHLTRNRGGGQALSEASRAFFEPRFGQDFSDVRVHADSQANDGARQLSATAFTTGQDIYFGEGRFQPDSPDGKRLLAHELAHVVQQRDGQGNPTQRSACDSPPLHIQRDEFGENIRFDSLPGPPPRARLYGPFTDEAIAEELYGDRAIPVRHDRSDHTIIFVQYAELRSQWKPYFRSAVGERDEDFHEYSDEQLAEAGVFALGTLLHESSTSAGLLRNTYNQGIEGIIAERANMLRQAIPGEASERIIRDLGSNLDRDEMVRRLREALPEEQATRIAQRVSAMRHQLALEVRQTGSAVLRKGAELVDAVRGQGRPAYLTLRAAGKTDAEIIISASRSNRFINVLPRGMRVSGGVLWFASAGISVYIILSADPVDRERVAREEIGALIGGALGTAAMAGICTAASIATAGLGLAVCGILGGMVGGAIGRDPWAVLQALDIAPHVSPGRAGRMYRFEGSFVESDFLLIPYGHRGVAAASDHVLVIATGDVSGQLVGVRGHYRQVKVVPANSPAVRLFGNERPQWVDEYQLHPFTPQDLEVE